MMKPNEFTEDQWEDFIEIIKDFLLDHNSGDEIDLHKLIDYIYSRLLNTKHIAFKNSVMSYLQKHILMPNVQKDIYNLQSLHIFLGKYVKVDSKSKWTKL